MKRLALILAALAALAVLVFALRPTSSVGREDAPPETKRAVPGERVVDAVPTHRADPAGVVEHTWQVDYAHTVSLSGQNAGHQHLVGSWIAVPVGPDRMEVQLDVDRLDGTLAPVSEAELQVPFQLGMTDGRLSGAGFAPGVSPAARNLLMGLATQMIMTPGEGLEWRVEETDLNGRYIALYQSTGDGARRIRDAFVAVHTGQGEGDPEGITATGAARYRFDGEGVVAITVDETISRAFEALNSTATAVIALRADRVQARRVAPPTRLLPLHPIAPVVDPAGLVAAERNRIGDADLDQVLAWAAEAAENTGDDEDAVHARATAHARMRAFLRVHPTETAAFVEALKAAPEAQALSMIAALGAAGTPAATAGLVDVLEQTDDALQARHAHVALGMSKAPSAESVEVLLHDIDDPQNGTTAALAAGNQARILGDGAPEADDIVQSLVGRYFDAADDAARVGLVAALGNTGDRRALPALTDAMGRGAGLTRVAAYALRHVPGEDVDRQLQALLLQHPYEMVRIQAARAVADRDRARWTPILEEVLPRLEAAPMVHATVARVLDRWAGRG